MSGIIVTYSIHISTYFTDSSGKICTLHHYRFQPLSLHFYCNFAFCTICTNSILISLLFSVFPESFIQKKCVFDFPYIVQVTTLITFAALNCKSAFVILYPSISFPVLTASTISSTFFWQPGIWISLPA